MARPKKAVVDYFPHLVNHGKTMFTLESKYGNEGYAFWFKLLEMLGISEHHYIDCNDVETWEYLLAKTRFREDNANSILDLLARLGAIDNELWENKIIRSDNFIDNLETVYKRRNIDVYTKQQIMDKCIQKTPLNGVIVNINPQSKVKETKGKESIVIEDDNRNHKLINETENKEPEEIQDKIPYQQIKNLYNTICKSLPEVRQISDKRRIKIKTRYEELKSVEAFEEIFNKAEQSNFLTGINDKGWKCSFDWLIENDNNYLKVLEGKYDNVKDSKPGAGNKIDNMSWEKFKKEGKF